MANYLPFNSVLDGEGNPDRAVKAEDWAWYFSTFIGNGVFPNPSDGLQVLADTGMNVTVCDGYGFINGYAFRNPSDYTLTIATADGSLGRIDRIVLRWSLTNRWMVLDVLQGTLSASPVAPDLTRTADTYELALADISVAAGITTITQSMITDRRSNTDLCGIVEGTVSQIDWATLTAQLDAFLEEYSAAVVADYAAYTNQIETFEENFETDANTWMSGQQTTFIAWVASMRDVLDTETATHLQNEIEYLQQQVGIPDEYDPEEIYPKEGYCIVNNTLYRATKETVRGGFDLGYWTATTVLEEIQRRIDIEREKIYTKIANNNLSILSELVINDDGDHLLLDDLGTILAVNQTVKFSFA